MLPQKTFGLVIPFTLQAKLLIRQLWAEKVRKLRWNDNIISNLKPERITFFQALFGTQSTTFKRDPISVVFSDGSQEAFGNVSMQDGDSPMKNMKVTLLQQKEELHQLRRYLSCAGN